MVAETVKNYPYPALLPLTQQGLNYSCTTSSCGPSLLPQSLVQPYPPQSSPMMERSHSARGRSGSSQGANLGSTPSGLGAGGMIGAAAPMLKDSIFAQRKQREFIPDNKKDESYWDRRRRNNEAAKRSREKRRFNDMILEQRVIELSKENHILRAQLNALENKFHVKGEGLVNEEQVLATMPQAEQILSLTRRSNISILSVGSPTSLLSPSSLPSTSPAPQSQSNHSDDHQFAVPQYNQHHHMDQSLSSPPHSNARSHSPDYYPRDLPMQSSQPSQSLNAYPSESLHMYESTALNLSSRTTRSPNSLNFCYEQNRSLDFAGSSLPHKLRHKNQQHNTHSMSSNSFPIGRPLSMSPHQHDQMPATSPHLYQNSTSHLMMSAQSSLPRSSTSPPATHLLYPIKSEPISREIGEESPGSSDDRDSGISIASSPPLSGRPSYPSSNRGSTEDMDCDSEQQLRVEVQRLATEVRSLKSILSRNVDTHRRRDSPPRR
ncbi:nuclear factor interleukin-3-regulated protein isoform X2 [Hyalella azteca]|nr:nuclear factor interleukin-3-regulated protein isoform X2 [Hyalella azteca]